jgi:hypothetical protein
MRKKCKVRSEIWFYRDCEWIPKEQGVVILSLIRSCSLNPVVLDGTFGTALEWRWHATMESDDVYDNREIKKTWSDRLGPLEQSRECMERLRSDVPTFMFASNPTQGLSTLIGC